MYVLVKAIKVILKIGNIGLEVITVLHCSSSSPDEDSGGGGVRTAAITEAQLQL